MLSWHRLHVIWGLIKRLKGSFSACLFLIDIKNENRGFLSPPTLVDRKILSAWKWRSTDGDSGVEGFVFVFVFFLTKISLSMWGPLQNWERLGSRKLHYFLPKHEMPSINMSELWWHSLCIPALALLCGYNKPHLFLPHLLEVQHCERKSYFRRCISGNQTPFIFRNLYLIEINLGLQLY